MRLYLQITTSLYLLLLLAAGTGHANLWGLYHLRAFPEWMSYGAALLGLAMIWSPLSVLSRMDHAVSRIRFNRKTGVAVLSVCAIGTVVLFIAGSSENLLLGDGFKRIDMIQKPLDFWPTEYVDLMAHRLLYRLVGNAEASYTVIAVAAGLLFLGAVLQFVRDLKLDTTSAVGVYLLMIGIAQIQFFFGYAESYAIMTAFTALFLLFGYRYVAHGHNFWLAMVFFALSGIFHLTGWFLLPGMLYLLALRGARSGSLLYRIATASVVAVALALAVAYYLAFEGERIFAPLIASETNPYSLFSAGHLFDILNELLLVAPLPLSFVIGTLLTPEETGLPRNRGRIFLILCTLGALFLLLAVDPVLGAVRDWDLLSLYAVPLAFLAGALLSGCTNSRRTRLTLLTAACALIIAHTAPWIVSNTDRIESKDLMKTAIARDLHYSPEYREGHLLTQWSFYLGYSYSDYEEMARAAGERVRTDPDHAGTVMMYAVGSYLTGQEEQLLWALDRLEKFPAIPPRTLNRVLRMRLHMGDMDKLRESVAEAKVRFPEDTYVLTLEWVVTYIESNPQAVTASYDSVMASAPLKIVMDYAAINITLHRYEVAKNLLDRASAFRGLNAVDRAFIGMLRERLKRESGVRE